ncbi:hypothetical protein L873DRAFT_535989 [Choiromyces venosus 120613-1]|uniref:Uncharacterized protein n=1 Tax=Choiromyces venosus 120613-1 TaxID=1336337 RepID=A0A3N4K5B9_9PEZI|nr:hypothetical protein L873DRAFT_535989 [Choiromyces venosus 120613-1]
MAVSGLKRFLEEDPPRLHNLGSELTGYYVRDAGEHFGYPCISLVTLPVQYQGLLEHIYTKTNNLYSMKNMQRNHCQQKSLYNYTRDQVLRNWLSNPIFCFLCKSEDEHHFVSSIIHKFNICYESPLMRPTVRPRKKRKRKNCKKKGRKNHKN